MRSDWKYIAYLVLAVLIYLGLKLFSARNIDWTVTYHRNDKNPFGTYALNQFIGQLFPGQTIHQSNYTFYELLDTVNSPVNLVSFSTRFQPGKEDTDALLNNLLRGGTAFIAAQYFDGPFADSLSIHTSDYMFDNPGFSDKNDTLAIQFKNSLLSSRSSYRFPARNIHNHFMLSDSLACTIVAENNKGLPVLLKINWGNGTLYVCSVPLTFTNVYFLSNKNYEFAELALSHLPNHTTYRTEYYHLGRLEAGTPLRFILSNEPLRWAYFVALFALMLFMIFEAKRKQRIIPIIRPLGNTSLEFVRTIGNLYYQSKDHRSIAVKRITFFSEQLRSKHGIYFHRMDDLDPVTLARKTGNSAEESASLIETIKSVLSKNQLTDDELKSFNQKMDSFRL